ncbi:hypothetical protein [Nocardiopsis sp. Huas11]|uniref:hypothetical protein n=1 Tax=Nocardiopsis sp. Huas11 TaxID=2183912 RepID=UPI001315232C|nr:hypothetical protein [Nocardiopsis sp. Huas11]
MKVVVRVKSLPSPEQAKALAATLHACNQAANAASEMALPMSMLPATSPSEAK